MKIKVLVSLLFLLLTSFSLILFYATAAETLDLSGEWDAIFIRMREEAGESFDAEECGMKIVQNGNGFIGRCMNGTKRIGKDEEAVKGKIASDKLEETFVSYPIDQITFKLDWRKARTTINKDKNLIVMYSFIESDPAHWTVVLKRKK